MEKRKSILKPGESLAELLQGTNEETILKALKEQVLELDPAHHHALEFRTAVVLLSSAFVVGAD